MLPESVKGGPVGAVFTEGPLAESAAPCMEQAVAIIERLAIATIVSRRFKS
jgi:hypothetical protein